MAISLLAFSAAAPVARAQQSPNDFRDDFSFSDDATFGVAFATPAAGPAVASAALDELSAGPREVGTSSGRVTSATSAHQRVPVVTDWSTKHMIFGPPKTEEQKARLEHNTRYKMQVARRSAPALRQVADARADSGLLDRFAHRGIDPRTRPTKASPLQRDWTFSLAPGATVGDGQFPSKFTFDISAAPDCTSDFAVYNTNTSLLVAFNSLYSGSGAAGDGLCGTGGPAVYWAYDVATNGGVTSTSTTISFDVTGSTIIFVESTPAVPPVVTPPTPGIPSKNAVLHILRWKAGDGVGLTNNIAPIVPTLVTDPTVWGAGCSSCMWSIPFSTDATGPSGATTAGDSNSAPYYDIDNDVLYVGDDNGYIHQFLNVLNGGTTAAPSEATGNWPIWMDTSAFSPQTGPIYDSISSRVFAGNNNGELKYINLDSTSGDTCVVTVPMGYTYPCLGTNNLETGSYPLPDPPIVDGTYGTVFVFQAESGADAGVFQSPTNTCVCGTPGAPGPTVTFTSLGTKGGVQIHAGDFDNNYYTSGTGYLYTCAFDPTAAFTSIRRIAMTGGAMGTTADTLFAPVTSSPYSECSPGTEVFNLNDTTAGPLGTDYIFFSVTEQSTIPDCTNGGTAVGDANPGCLMSFILNSGTGLMPTVPTAALYESGGTSGIVIDNVSTAGQASSVYFTPLANGVGGPCAGVGCAVKATQDGLN